MLNFCGAFEQKCWIPIEKAVKSIKMAVVDYLPEEAEKFEKLKVVENMGLLSSCMASPKWQSRIKREGLMLMRIL